MSWAFLGEGCDGTPQQSLGFATTLNMWDFAGRLKLDNLHRCPQPFHVVSFGFVTTSILDRQSHTFFLSIL
jgi:hypothetical protein